MPTDVISKIGATNSPTTMDYTTLQSWEDACPANLVTADQRWIGECYDQGEFVVAQTCLAISGETTDATRYIILRCATGASFKDKTAVRTTPLAYDATKGVAIRTAYNYAPAITVDATYTQLIGLQIKSQSLNSSLVIFGGVTFVATGMVASQCIGHAPNQVGGAVFDIGNGDGGNLYNCLMICGGANSIGANVRNGGAYGCTAVRTGTASGSGFAVTSYRLAVIKNCASFGFTNGSSLGTSSAYDTGTGFNATDAASMGGSNNQVSLTYASQFVDSTADWRAVSSGSLKNGTPDATNTPNDISGTARDATTPYIGAWEVTTGAWLGSNMFMCYP